MIGKKIGLVNINTVTNIRIVCATSLRKTPREARNQLKPRVNKTSGKITTGANIIVHCREVGDELSAESLEAWRGKHDPFELKDWIEKKLEQVWELDRALRSAESEGEIDLEGVAGPILKSRLRSAPTALQNRKHDSTSYPNPDNTNPTNQDATESSKAA